MGEREALHWRSEDGQVRCRLCPFTCLIGDGVTGRCLVRKNRGGRLVPLTYARITSAHLDLIEKKPLYHFHAGRNILSLGTWGCSCGGQALHFWWQR